MCQHCKYYEDQDVTARIVGLIEDKIGITALSIDGDFEGMDWMIALSVPSDEEGDIGAACDLLTTIVTKAIELKYLSAYIIDKVMFKETKIGYTLMYNGVRRIDSQEQMQALMGMLIKHILEAKSKEQ